MKTAQIKTDEEELEYERQVRSERPKIKKDAQGRPKRVWVQSIKDNHYFDCECEQVVMATICDVLIDTLEDGE